MRSTLKACTLTFASISIFFNGMTAKGSLLNNNTNELTMSLIVSAIMLGLILQSAFRRIE